MSGWMDMWTIFFHLCLVKTEYFLYCGDFWGEKPFFSVLLTTKFISVDFSEGLRRKNNTVLWTLSLSLPTILTLTSNIQIFFIIRTFSENWSRRMTFAIFIVWQYNNWSWKCQPYFLSKLLSNLNLILI